MTEIMPVLPQGDIESKPVMKMLVKAHQALAELKGVAAIIPNQTILVSTLSLQEAKDSSAIENIITTHDDIYQSDRLSQQFATLAAKEVHNYAAALYDGYEQVERTGLLTNNDIIKIQAAIEGNKAGFRKVPGTALKNEQTEEVIYTPPSPEKLAGLMAELERFINEDLVDWDPLTRMAVIHHHFESIHPFYDGNGRTGRVINILYLVKEGLLHSPVLYLSRYINQNKADYYCLLQKVRTDQAWEEWLLFMLEGIAQTSRQTVTLIQGMKVLMQSYKNAMRQKLPKIYSQDLINNLFRHPYTKIDFVVRELQVHRNTATKYLEELVGIGLLVKHKIGKENYYVNQALYDLLLSVGQQGEAGT
ncbi:MAG: addiction module protein [Desulfobulbaceae bacterium]|nr:MAG: addiction module protein [Desulfobulbaceae bacterium]